MGITFGDDVHLHAISIMMFHIDACVLFEVPLSRRISEAVDSD